MVFRGKDIVGGETKIVNVQYVCGDFVHDGPAVTYSRLRRFSKRARRELLGGTTWIVRCQHYEQAPLFDKILEWFKVLPDRDVRVGFVEAKHHPAIDREDIWLSQLSWKELILMDHCVDYVHLREPLDTRKVRGLLWGRLERLQQDPLTAEDMHLAYQLLQFKRQWLRENTLDDAQRVVSAPSTYPSTMSATSSSRPRHTRVVSSSLNDELLECFTGWESLNSALLRNMVRKVATWLDDIGGDEAYDAYADLLRMQALASTEHAAEPNDVLLEALDLAFKWLKNRRRPAV